MAAGIAAAVAASVPALAFADSLLPVPVEDQVVFYTPIDGQTANDGAGTVHIVLGGGTAVDHVDLSYTTGLLTTPTSIATLPARSSTTDTFDYTWHTTLNQTVTLQAIAKDAANNPVDTVTESVTLSPTSGSKLTFTKPTTNGVPLGVFARKDGHWFAGVSGKSTGATAPTAVDAAHPDTAPATALPQPAGFFDAGTDEYDEPVDLTGDAASGDPTTAAIRVSDGTSSNAIQTPLYTQTVTAIRASTKAVPGSNNVTITARATDQYGQPVVGVPVRLAGHVAGVSSRVDQLAVTDALGWVDFTGTTPGAGYPTGFYTAYADLNVNDLQGPKEPAYEVVRGTVSYVAPGRALYHNDKHIKNAGGVYGDAAKGTKAAASHGFTWIDQDGQIAFASHVQKASGRISTAGDLVWVNAHGSPYNPKWLKKGRFETKAWSSIKKHAGLRDAAKTFRQDAAHHLGVEWEVKDVHPFSTAAALDAAFANLATQAQTYYGAAWRSMVQVKVLSNLHGGQKYALKVLKHAKAHGFTTMFLARGGAVSSQIPASAQTYVDYVRGAVDGEYAVTPPASQFTPVRTVTPPSVAARK